jgi:hypothetical protein
MGRRNAKCCTSGKYMPTTLITFHQEHIYWEQHTMYYALFTCKVHRDNELCISWQPEWKFIQEYLHITWYQYLRSHIKSKYVEINILCGMVTYLLEFVVYKNNSNSLAFKFLVSCQTMIIVGAIYICQVFFFSLWCFSTWSPALLISTCQESGQSLIFAELQPPNW